MWAADEADVTHQMLGDAGIEALRAAFADYTVDAVQDLLGPIGGAALERGDLAGVARAVRGDAGRTATLIRLFLLGAEVDERDAARALAPLDLDAATALVERSGGSARATVDVRPYSEAGGAAVPWWVVSDFGSDVRGGPLRSDHVLGIGAASLTLAQSTPRDPVRRALDLGTGCGIQSLHLSAHAGSVTATDVSPRALRLAATTAALSGVDWDLRLGSLLEPVAQESYDLVVANPPFVVSAGDGGYDYRDSGLAGDAVCRDLVRGVPALLRPGGTAQLLANWVIPADGDADERLTGWFDRTGCDAWVWRREIAEPAEYVALWLRDAGEVPGSARWIERYDAWLDWFATAGIAAVGMGLITLWRTETAAPTVVVQDVPQAVERPAGAHVAAWITRQRRLSGTDDDGLLRATLVAAPDLVRERADLITPGEGWVTATVALRQSYGMRWQLDVDDAMAALVAGCDGTRPLRTTLAVLAGALGADPDAVRDAALPVVRDLIGRGFLDFAVDPVAGGAR